MPTDCAHYNYIIIMHVCSNVHSGHACAQLIGLGKACQQHNNYAQLNCIMMQMHSIAGHVQGMYSL